MKEEIIGENTLTAWDFATDSSHGTRDVESNWWQNFSDYRLRCWREELDELTETTGVSLQDICKYLSVTYTKGIGFYDKLPKKREMYIGIGMAFKQPLETINTWLTRYGMKRKLYVKDLEADLSWMHLICANYMDRSSLTNYYSKFDECQAAIHEAYMNYWDEDIDEDNSTVIVEMDLQAIPYQKRYREIKEFVIGNIDSFKTAYVRPRVMLNEHLKLLVDEEKQNDGRFDSLNSLRGYLDDSMINYLSGSVNTINVIDRKSGKRSLQFKHIPKSKRAHISLALALGMSIREIDQYLSMMGFAKLDAVNMDEGLLLNAMTIWEREHPAPKRYKKWFHDEKKTKQFDPSEIGMAVQQMLDLREDLQIIFERFGRPFPYMK